MMHGQNLLKFNVPVVWMTTTALEPATLWVTTQWARYKLQHLVGQTYGTEVQHEEIIFTKGKKKVKLSQNIGILMQRKEGGRAETNCQQESTDLARVGTGSVYTNEDTWIEERLAAGAISRRSPSSSVRKSITLHDGYKKDGSGIRRLPSTFIKFLSNVPDAPVFTLRH